MTASAHPFGPPLPDPGTLVPGVAQVNNDEQQRWLAAVQQKYEADRQGEEKQLELERRNWQVARNRHHQTLMSQVPKLIGGAVVGSVVGGLLYLLTRSRS